MLAKLLLVLSAAACIGTNTLPLEPLPASDATAKTTVETREYVTHDRWQRSGYARLGDEVIALPVLIAIAGDGTACFITGDVWAVWRPQRLVSCPSGWRFRRPV